MKVLCVHCVLHDGVCSNSNKDWTWIIRSINKRRITNEHTQLANPIFIFLPFKGLLGCGMMTRDGCTQYGAEREREHGSSAPAGREH